MKKCYNAKVTIEAMILAESQEEAEKLALRALEEEMDNYLDPRPWVALSRGYATGWGRHTLVYHAGKEDITAEDALKLNQ